MHKIKNKFKILFFILSFNQKNYCEKTGQHSNNIIKLWTLKDQSTLDHYYLQTLLSLIKKKTKNRLNKPGQILRQYSN